MQPVYPQSAGLVRLLSPLLTPIELCNAGNIRKPSHKRSRTESKQPEACGSSIANCSSLDQHPFSVHGLHFSIHDRLLATTCTVLSFSDMHRIASCSMGAAQRPVVKVLAWSGEKGDHSSTSVLKRLRAFLPTAMTPLRYSSPIPCFVTPSKALLTTCRRCRRFPSLDWRYWG